MQEKQAIVINKTFLADDVMALELNLTSPEGWTFLPGQFVQFKIGDHYRAYSITSLLTDLPKLSFLIELVNGGLGSEFVRSLEVGHTVIFRGASGLFSPKDSDDRHAFVATGVGIAPFRPIIKSLMAKPNHQTALLFGGRIQERLWFRGEFQNLMAPNFQYFETLTNANLDWQGLRGRVTDHLADFYQDYKGAIFHVCGSRAMVTDVRAWLIEHGHDLPKIKLEIFF